ncbi:MAG: response regulator [Bryobacteraceae bacterium]|nr:response regulator [Bryobacteraceae bacterium]
MPVQLNKRVLGVVEDLIFIVKIADAAKRSGLQVQFVKTEQDALSAVTEPPLLVIVDLNANSVDPIDLISKLKSDGSKLAVIAFVSHVQGELKQRAHDAGADMVMARSAFSTNLPQILKRHSGSY